MNTPSAKEPGRRPAVYLAERYEVGLDIGHVTAAATRAARTAARMTEEGTPVRHLGATYLPSEDAVFDLYEATSAESVRQAAELAGISVQHVTEAIQVGHPSTDTFGLEPSSSLGPRSS